MSDVNKTWLLFRLCLKWEQHMGQPTSGGAVLSLLRDETILRVSLSLFLSLSLSLSLSLCVCDSAHVYTPTWIDGWVDQHRVLAYHSPIYLVYHLHPHVPAPMHHWWLPVDLTMLWCSRWIYDTHTYILYI